MINYMIVTGHHSVRGYTDSVGVCATKFVFAYILSATPLLVLDIGRVKSDTDGGSAESLKVFRVIANLRPKVIMTITVTFVSLNSHIFRITVNFFHYPDKAWRI